MQPLLMLRASALLCWCTLYGISLSGCFCKDTPWACFYRHAFSSVACNFSKTFACNSSIAHGIQRIYDLHQFHRTSDKLISGEYRLGNYR